MIMWFGVGPGSKIAMGALSCFFPIALSVAGRHAPDRQGADPRRPELPRQHLADGDQDLSAGDAPARSSTACGSGLGVAIIGTLLAETKLSNRGIGFLIIQAYSIFDMPRMYALLIVLFVLAIGANALIGRLGGLDDIKRR